MATNLGFEDAGAGPGLAAGWTSTFVASDDLYADFSGGIGPHLSRERWIPGWSTDGWTAIAGGELARFDDLFVELPNTVERFSFWHGNRAWSPVVVLAVAATFSGYVGALLETDFTVESWRVQWVAVPALGSSMPDSFDWHGSVVTVPTLGDRAPFDNTSTRREHFAPVFGDVVFVADPSTSTFTAVDATGAAVAHNYAANARVTCSSSGTNPKGVQVGLAYYVSIVNSHDFKLSETSGGSTITITDSGTGTHSAHADESAFWTSPG